MGRVRSALHLWHIRADGSKKHDTLADHPHPCPTGELDAAFHRYGLERRGGKLRFYLDGEKYWTYDAKKEGHPRLATQWQPIILYVRGVAAHDVVASELPACFLVDYVTVHTIDERGDGG